MEAACFTRSQQWKALQHRIPFHGSSAANCARASRASCLRFRGDQYQRMPRRLPHGRIRILVFLPSTHWTRHVSYVLAKKDKCEMQTTLSEHLYRSSRNMAGPYPSTWCLPYRPSIIAVANSSANHQDAILGRDLPWMALFRGTNWTSA